MVKKNQRNIKAMMTIVSHSLPLYHSIISPKHLVFLLTEFIMVISLSK